MSARMRHLALYTEKPAGMTAYYKTVFGMQRITQSFNNPNHSATQEDIDGRRIGEHASADPDGLLVVLSVPAGLSSEESEDLTAPFDKAQGDRGRKERKKGL